MQTQTMINDWDGAIITAGQVREIAYPPAVAGDGFDELLNQMPRLALNNETRQGIVDKATGETLPDVWLQLVKSEQLYSHMNPADGEAGPRHESSKSWCESRNKKQTSAEGYSCVQCAARDACGWKIELTVIRETDAGPVEYLFTLPTASAVRFRQTLKTLTARHNAHPTQVLWSVTAQPYSDKEKRRVYPVAIWRAFELESKTEYDLSEQAAVPRSPTPAPANTRSAAPALPPVAVGDFGRGVVVPSKAANSANIPGVQRGIVPSVTPDHGNPDEALEVLGEISDRYYKQFQARPVTDEQLRANVTHTQAALSKTILKDTELRHAFVRTHWEGATMDGSLNDLHPAIVKALNDWVARKDANAYLARWHDEMMQNTK